MLKKICLSWIICIVSSQQVLCGTGYSIPIDEDKEENPARNSKPPQKNNNLPKINFEEVAASSNSKSYTSGASSESSEEGSTEEVTEENRNYPVIDLRFYDSREDIVLHPQSSKVDLHPVYKNPEPYLAKEIFRLQRDYHFSKIPDAKVFIITGTGKSRPGPNFRLKKTVINSLQTKEFFTRRIADHNLHPGEGILTVFLRKNIMPPSSQNGEVVYVLDSLDRGWGQYQIDLRNVDFSEDFRLSLPNMCIKLTSYLDHQFSQVHNMQAQRDELAQLREQMIQGAGLSNQRSKDLDSSSEEEDSEVYVITGRGEKFPGYNLTLKNAVIKSLERKCFQHPISDYDDTPEQGLSIFLKRKGLS